MLRRGVYHRGFTGVLPDVYPIFPVYSPESRSNQAQKGIPTVTLLEAWARWEAPFPLLISRLSPGPLPRATPHCCAPRHDRAGAGSIPGCT